jgi:hypothetical protein
MPEPIQPLVPAGADPERYIPTVYEGKLDPNFYCRSWTGGEDAKYCGQRAGWGTLHVGQGRCYLHGGVQEGDARYKTGKYSMERGGIKHKTIADLYEQFLADPDPTNLLDELAMLKALTVHFINEHEVRTEALLAWHAERMAVPRDLPEGLIGAMQRGAERWEANLRQTDDWKPRHDRFKESVTALFTLMRGGEPNARPRKVSDIADATKFLDDIGRMAERFENMRSKSAISEMELNRIINQMGRVADVLIPNGPINLGIVDVEKMLTGELLKTKIRDGWILIVAR